MKKGEKLKRLCSTCQTEKEQVKDGMIQSSDGSWICDTCLQLTWESDAESQPVTFKEQS